MSRTDTSLAQAFVPPQYMRFWEFRTQAVKHLFENEERKLELIEVYEQAKVYTEPRDALMVEKALEEANARTKAQIRAKSINVKARMAEKPINAHPPSSVGRTKKPITVNQPARAEFVSEYGTFCGNCIEAARAGEFNVETFLFGQNLSPSSSNTTQKPIELRPFMDWHHASNLPEHRVEARKSIEGLRAQWEDHYFQFVAGALYDGRLQAFVDKSDNEGPQPITNANWWLHPNMRQGLTTKGNVSQDKKGSMPPLFLREQVRKLCPPGLDDAEGKSIGKEAFAKAWLAKKYPDGEPKGKTIQELRSECIADFGDEISRGTFGKAQKHVWGEG